MNKPFGEGIVDLSEELEYLEVLIMDLVGMPEGNVPDDIEEMEDPVTYRTNNYFCRDHLLA